MTKLLEEAMRKAASLPEEKQDKIGANVLAEIEADAEWDATLTIKVNRPGFSGDPLS